MTKKLLLLLLIAPAMAAPAGQDLDATVRRDVEAYFSALEVSDFPTLARLTYPGVVQSVGGFGTFIGLLQQMDQARRAQGIEWGDVAIQTVSEPVVAGEELHVLVKVLQQIGSPSGKTKKKTYMLGVSADQGQNWTFVDATKLDAENRKKLFPSFNDQLELPKR